MRWRSSQEALALKPRPQVIWMQLGVRNDEAAALAEANGIKVVMNRCPKIEYGRLSSEIAWMGVNSRTLSAKKRAKLGGGIQRMSLDRTTAARRLDRRGHRRRARAKRRPLSRRPQDGSWLARLLVAVARITHTAVAS